MEGAALSVIAAAALPLVGLTLWYLPPLRRRRRVRAELQARRAFRRHREMLEARFFDLAARSGKPRGLNWVDIDFLDAVTFARDRTNGMLAAFVAVNIRFEAVPGGDMEDVAAVGNVRDGTALFHCERGIWGTGGKTLFNVCPQDAISRFHSQFEPLSESVPLSV